MILWTTSPQQHLRFYYYHLQPLFQFERGQISEHMQASFRMEDLYGYSVAVPPAAEQVAIACFLDEVVAGQQALVGEAEKAVALLVERRAALISAAVTGKIDVRNSVSYGQAAA